MKLNKAKFQQQLTEKSLDIGKEETWYFVNAKISQKNRKILAKFQNEMKAEFGDAVWCVPKDFLHVTLMDWIAPFGDYEKDREAIFAEIYDSFNKATEEVLARYAKIDLCFKGLKIASDAVVALFEDDGSFQKIREDIVSKVCWVRGNKNPPNIIHSTLVRFAQEIPLREVEKLVSGFKVSFDEVILEFQLGKGIKTGIMECEIVKKYPLGKIIHPVK